MRKLAAAILTSACVVLSPNVANATMGEWITSFERLLGGLKVYDKQISASQQQTQQVIKKSEEAAVNAELAQDKALKLAEIKERYGYEAGQGDMPCGLAESRKGMSSVKDAQKRTLAAFSAGQTGYINVGGSRAAMVKNSLLKRIGHYCTMEEQLAMGYDYCLSSSGNERNAGDSNAAPFLVSADHGSGEVVQAADFIDVMAPMPTIEPNAQDVREQIALIEARKEAAILSAARSAMMGIAVSSMGGE